MSKRNAVNELIIARCLNVTARVHMCQSVRGCVTARCGSLAHHGVSCSSVVEHPTRSRKGRGLKSHLGFGFCPSIRFSHNLPFKITLLLFHYESVDNYTSKTTSKILCTWRWFLWCSSTRSRTTLECLILHKCDSVSNALGSWFSFLLFFELSMRRDRPLLPLTLSFLNKTENITYILSFFPCNIFFLLVLSRRFYCLLRPYIEYWSVIVTYLYAEIRCLLVKP